MGNTYAIFLVMFVLLMYFLVFYYYFIHKKQKKISQSCDIHSCKTIDPVSDPKYNMQQIVKQSILLEEHLANKNKRCRDCITKHFLHIIGLAEEAQMLATNKIDQYPLINECVTLYNGLFNKWLQKYDIEGETNVLNCCDSLRNMRKKLIVVYFFDGKL